MNRFKKHSDKGNKNPPNMQDNILVIGCKGIALNP